MSIAFACSQCGKRFNVPDEFAGKKARCKGCGGSVVVPSPKKANERAAANASQGDGDSASARTATKLSEGKRHHLFSRAKKMPRPRPKPQSVAKPAPERESKPAPQPQRKPAPQPQGKSASPPQRKPPQTPPQPAPAPQRKAGSAAVATAAVETSPSGNPIYRYEGKEINRSRVARDPASIRAIAEHIHTHVGEVDHVLEAGGDEPLPVDLHLIAPRRDRPVRTVVTSGMSNYAMNAPAGAEDERRIELVLGLSANWPVGRDAMRHEHHAFPLMWLKQLASLPHSLDTWLSWGHTVPNGDPPDPLGPGTEMTGWMLIPPVWLPEEFWSLVVSEEKTVNFYAIIPLYTEEMDFKLQQGAEALIDRLSELPLTALFDFKRPNVCKSTVTIACACGAKVEAPASMAGQRAPCPKCGGSVIVPRRGFYDEKKSSVTLDDKSSASLPGNVKVNPIRYLMHFPKWPLIWGGSCLAFFALAAGLGSVTCLIAALALLALNGLYWFRVKEHFLHGCINPGVVVSTDPLLIAVSTDLTTGWKPWPVVKILRHPIRSINGQPPQVGMRLSTIALYEPGNDDSHWANFDPKAVECVTADRASIHYTLSQLDEEDWLELDRKLAQVPRPFKPGLYHTPDG